MEISMFVFGKSFIRASLGSLVLEGEWLMGKGMGKGRAIRARRNLTQVAIPWPLSDSFH